LAVGAERKPPAATNVIPFARDAAAKESPLAKKLRAMNATHAAFWREDAEQFDRLKEKHGSDEKAHRVMQAARPIVDEFTLKAGATSHAAAVAVVEAQQKQRAMKPRNVDRNRRIHALAAEGKPANVIAKLVSGLKGKRLSASQVRKILAKPPVRIVSEK
jgi:hypothetical protein